MNESLGRVVRFWKSSEYKNKGMVIKVVWMELRC
jgi:hypothetical protein